MSRQAVFHLLLLSLIAIPARADITSRAYEGAPFGVGVITLTPDDFPRKWFHPYERAEVLPHVSDADILERLGPNAFYPVVLESRLGGDLRRNAFRGREGVQSWTILFLFRKKEPFDVQLSMIDPKEPRDDAVVQHRITPVDDPVQFAALRTQWWNAFVERGRSNASRGAYPLQLDQYLTAMLARRMELKDVDISARSWLGSDSTARFIGILTGTESIRIAMQKEALLDVGPEKRVANRPLPKPVTPPPVPIPEPDPDAVVEPIAAVVPHECFYVRFGSFTNFAWFRDRTDRWGSNIRDIATIRGMDYGISDRLQRQLEIRDSTAARLLGPEIIQDVAIIGTDTFVREGAAIGVLFHAKNSAALSASLKLQRTARADSDVAVQLDDVKFDGFDAEASFLHTPDNRVRSFYVRHDDFHLITTSRTIARRFLEAASGKDPLGPTKEFRHARSIMPLTRNDSVFIYLSDAFFRIFVEPHYRIEMTRRAQSESRIELVELAARAAKAEGHPHGSVADLVAGGFLPKHFNIRPDRSRVVNEQGVWLDSLRGRRGTFVPVPDVTLDGATSSEEKAYAEFAKDYRRIWERMDPAMVGIRRSEDGRLTKLNLDLHVFPFPQRDMGMQWLQTPKDKTKIAPIDDALITVELNLFAGSPMFAGLMDADIPFFARNGRFEAVNDGIETRLPWFIGSRPYMALPSVLGIEIPKEWPAGEVAERGKGVFDAWAARTDEFCVAGPHKPAIETLLKELKFVESDHFAKARVRIGDIGSSKSAKFANAMAWSQARYATLGNTQFLNRLVTQLHVEPAQALREAGTILNASLSSPVGAPLVCNKQLIWEADPGRRMNGYRFPLLDWLKSAEFAGNSVGNVLETHVEIVVDDRDD